MSDDPNPPTPKRASAGPPPMDRIRAGHEAVRRANRQELVEDYVEAIDDLNRSAGEARVRDLAAGFGISHVAVSTFVERLRREGLVSSGQQQAIELTAEGRRIAARSRKRHATVLSFLMALGLPAEIAETDAEGMEHHAGPETLAAFARYVEAHPAAAPPEGPGPLAEDAAPRFARVREAHASELTEDYVEAIDDLVAAHGEARIGRLAQRFGVSQVTVTRVVARLRRTGLVISPPRQPLVLSEAGEALAARSRDRHQVVLRFLLFLGVPREPAEVDAEGLEHHVSERTLARFATLSGAGSPEVGAAEGAAEDAAGDASEAPAGDSPGDLGLI